MLKHILLALGSSKLPLPTAGPHSAIKHGIADDIRHGIVDVAKAQAAQRRTTLRVCCQSTALFCSIGSGASPAAARAAARALRMPSMQHAAAGDGGATAAAWTSEHTDTGVRLPDPPKILGIADHLEAASNAWVHTVAQHQPGNAVQSGSHVQHIIARCTGSHNLWMIKCAATKQHDVEQ